ncbi:MAG: hypothetical protein ABGZ23_12630 [Fuerstiella sp.]
MLRPRRGLLFYLISVDYCAVCLVACESVYQYSNDLSPDSHDPYRQSHGKS